MRMKRQLIAVILMLAIGLQGSIAAFAATSPSMSTDCQSADACCPKGQHAMSCCLDLCLAPVGVTVSPTTLAWYARSTPIVPASISTFSSRGDSPLIRPPIL
jgi:hypothetical protein